jgi:hydroxymethylglutaryl-CoA reductase (NADPH)
MSLSTPIPTKFVGPILIKAATWQAEVDVPMATFETTLWPSTNRGAEVTKAAGGINVTLLSNCMTRSILLYAPNAQTAAGIAEEIKKDFVFLQNAVSQSSRFCKLEAVHTEVVGSNLYVRLSCFTGDAAGHNMTTKAADEVIKAILAKYPALNYGSISANLCVDKKVSAMNAILGRGKSVIAEVVLSRELCEKHLRTTPELLTQLNINKNLLGGILAGSVRTANAHYANVLLATYLATGQDAANIVEGSQGITIVTVTPEGNCYFAVNVSNIIVGTIGNGKEHPEVLANLEKLDCLPDAKHPGKSSVRLAEIIAATTLCAELSLMAAQTNLGELTKSHMLFER